MSSLHYPHDVTPLDAVHELIGPADLIAEICEIDRTTVISWQRGGKYRNAGDIPSARHMRRLVEYSRKRNLGLTYEHVVSGAPSEEIAFLKQAQCAAE